VAPSLLDVRALTKAWPGAVAPTLDALDLELEPASLLVIEGANGAGKTTLLRIVAGLIEPDGGQVRVGGLRAIDGRFEYQRRLGVVTAGNGGVYARLNARQHLAFSARLQAVPRAERRASVDAAVARFELGDFADRRADRLSMGQRQRLRLALAFLHEPSVVLLDEPSNSLDVEGQAILERAVTRHVEAGGGVAWLVPSGWPSPGLAHDRLVLQHGALVRC
jgi:ABC-type multidrug transport system ATPase subunit